MSLRNSLVWPKTLNRRNESQLRSALLKEGLTEPEIISSVSGTKELLAWVFGDAHHKATGEYLDFEATWRFDEDRISEPLDRYFLDEVVIYDDD